MTLHNASEHPRIFYCRHMQPGVALYDREGAVLVDIDAMKNLIGSVGKRTIPVYLGHQDVDLKNIKDQAVGYVSDSFYGESDGWAWFKMIIVDDKGHEAIKKGWSVSNAYMPKEMGPAGTKNNLPYKSEVRDGEFTHLAIVPDPRYEGACIMTPDEFKAYQETTRQKLIELKNSKEKKPMLKFFKTEKKEITGAEVDADAMVELKNGKSVSMQALINNYIEQQEEEPKFVLVNGKKVAIEELANAMEKKNKKKMKKNDSEESVDMEKDEDVEGDQEEEGDDEIGEDKIKNKKMKKNKKEKKNGDMDEEEDCMSNDLMGDEADEKALEEQNRKKEKKNSKTEVEVDDKFFNELRNAHINPPKRTQAPMIVTSIDGIERGKQKYGSGTK